MVIFDPDSDASNGKVTVGNASTTVRELNRNRKFCFLTNDSDEDIYVTLGSTAVINQGIRLNANGGGTLIDGSYTGKITAICASGSKNLCFSEGD